MTVITRSILFPTPKPPERLVDPVAFFIALILAPLVVGLLGAPLLLIPSFAVLVGGLPYLLIGGPILWWALRRGEISDDRFFGLGFKTICALTIPCYLAFLPNFIARGSDIADALTLAWVVGLCAAICAVHAGLWGMVFAILYRRFRNPNFPV